MKRLFFVSFAVLAVLAISACAALKNYRPTYDVGLVEIEKPASTANRFGPKVLTTTKTPDAFTYQDEFINISWGIQANGLTVSLENRSDNSIKVIWDEAAFVDEDGVVHPVIHGGTKFINKYDSQRPTTIPTHAKMLDVVNSADLSVFSPNGWEQKMFLPLDLMTQEDSQRVASYFAGKTFRFVLPIQIQASVNDYSFLFKVNKTGVELQNPYGLYQR